MVTKRATFVALTLFLTLLANDAMAMHRTTTRVRRVRHTRHFRHIVWNPMFRGTHEALVRENEVLDQMQLPRIQDDEELARLEENEDLVPIHNTRYLTVSDNLSANRRYCRPWTRDFLEDFSQAYFNEFHRPLQITSLVRTIEQQHKLRRRNRNAAPEEGDTASTHLTGTTFDLLKRGMTRKEHKWVEQYFLPFKDQGMLEPVEERRQPVFHVMVYDTYGEWRESKKLASEREVTTE